MNISFEGKTVLITGASRGVGAACAKLYAEAGAKVVVHYNSNPEKANEVLKALTGKGHLKIQADMADPEDLEKMVDALQFLTGRIDILVNNAGIFEETDWLNMDYQSWQKYWKATISVNLEGAANLSFLLSKHMIEKGGGKIVNVSSRGAFRGEPDALPYGASKAGLNSVGQSMAKKLGDKNVFVFTLAPGYIMTDMTKAYFDGSKKAKEMLAQSPLNRTATAEEISRAVLMLSSDGMEYMTGCILDMNGASYLRS